jgi:hypothetical protein
LMGDETTDVLQYHRRHGIFPQESTSDQYFDEAQWESYRKLGEHIGAELFTPPSGPPGLNGANWSPSQMCAPPIPIERNTPTPFAPKLPEIRELRSTVMN